MKLCPLQKPNPKARVKEKILNTLNLECLKHSRTYADCLFSVCEKRKVICFLNFGEIRQGSLVEEQSTCSFENPILLDGFSCANRTKPGMFPSIVIPHGLCVAVVEQGHVWIAQTRIEEEDPSKKSFIEYRFKLVLTNDMGELVPSVTNSKGEVLTTNQAMGDWKRSSTQAYKDCFSRVQTFIPNAKYNSVGKLLAGISYDKSQELLKRCIKNDAFNMENARLQISVNWAKDWANIPPGTTRRMGVPFEVRGDHNG